MKIIVGSHTFHPDHSGIAIYATDFARYARESGHEVKVVTGFSFYPAWKKRKEDRFSIFRKEKYDGMEIYRGFQYVPSNPTGARRIIQELTFLLFAFFNFLRAGKSDVIVIFTTPVSLGAMGLFFSKIFSSKLVINVQDFQVEAADSLGLLGKLPVVSLLKKIEQYSYRKADLVTSISENMVALIQEKGIEKSKIYLWPNWINVEKESVVGNKNSFRNKFNIPEGIQLVGYAGNVGAKQGLKSLIDLALEFKESRNILFLIIGEGGDLANLKKYHADVGVQNLRFLPFLNPTEYKEFLGDADVIFISQKKIPKDIYFPSKLLGIMAASKQIFLAADKESELFKVIEKNELGLTAEIDNFAQIKNCMEQILVGEKRLNKFSENSWAFVQQFDRNVVLHNALKKIKSLIEE